VLDLVPEEKTLVVPSISSTFYYLNIISWKISPPVMPTKE
jgi:hypothetical protein